MSYEKIDLELCLVLDTEMQENLDIIQEYYNSLDSEQEWPREKVLEMVIRNGFAFRLADAAEAYRELIDGPLDN